MSDTTEKLEKLAFIARKQQGRPTDIYSPEYIDFVLSDDYLAEQIFESSSRIRSRGGMPVFIVGEAEVVDRGMGVRVPEFKSSADAFVWLKRIKN